MITLLELWIHLGLGYVSYVVLYQMLKIEFCINFVDHKAIVQLRKVKNLTRLIYMSCNPSAAAKNFVDLARPISKTLQEDPFVPVKAVAVDMFPYTPHCELIICFERWDKISNL